MDKLQQIAEKLRAADRIALFTHTNPDGDALGSSFAMKRILDNMGKRADLFLETDIPEKFGYIRAAYTIGPADGPYDAGLCLDCGEAKRLGTLADFFGKLPLRMSIDHHVSGDGFADIDYIVPQAAATGELVYALAKLLGMQLDEYTQKCLFTAISTDTGNFKFSNVTAATFHMAGELMEMGLKIREVTKQLYDTVKLSRLRFTGAVADRIRMYRDGRFAVLEVPDSLLAEYGLRHEDVEELPSIPLSVEGVLVSLVAKDDTVVPGRRKYSLRGKEVCDLSAVARTLGGGGHKNAAGFVSDAPVEQVVQHVLSLLPF